MHHLRHRSENGATSIENGANVAEVAHQYMHSLPRDQEEIINNMLREWKRDFNIAAAQLTTQGIHKAELIEFEEPEEVIVIPAYDITPEDQAKYEEYKRQRNQRVIDKFKGGER